MINNLSHSITQKHQDRLRALAENSSPPESILCADCNIPFLKREAYEIHIAGKKHAATVEKNERRSAEGVKDEVKSEFWCDVCDLDLKSRVTLDGHLEGKKHQGAVLAKKYATNYCEICRVAANGPLMFDAHVKSRGHRLLAGENDQEEKASCLFKCELCDVISASSVANEVHLNGKAHLARVAYWDVVGNKENGAEDAMMEEGEAAPSKTDPSPRRTRSRPSMAPSSK